MTQPALMLSSNHRNSAQPKLYYGWVIVAVCFIILTLVFGVRLSFAVFFVALIDEFGWSRADTALIFSISMMVFAATSTLAGIALDRWGARRTFGIGAAFLAVGLLLSSQIQTLWQLALIYGGVAGLGITILGLGPLASLIARWFHRRRGLAIGIAFAGTGVGSLLIIPGVEYLIGGSGWRAAYIVLAVLALATIPIILRFLRMNPEDLQLLPDGGSSPSSSEQHDGFLENWKMNQVIRTAAFWFLLLSALGAIGPIRMLTVHQLAIIVDAGFTRSFAAALVGTAGVITAIAFIVFGGLSDRVDRRLVYIFGSFSLILAMLILNRLQNNPPDINLVVIYTILFGIGEGSRASLVTAVASDLFPGDAMGGINGTVGAAFGVGAAIFPWLAGRLFDIHGNYTIVLGVAGIAVIISTISLSLAPLFKRVPHKHLPRSAN